MTARPDELTPLLQQQIVAACRAGGYGHVAAEAYGISRYRFRRWLRLGQGKGARAPYAGFAVEVRSALAQARLRAEIALLSKDAKAWLEHGPGRESPGNPGWTGPAKPPEPSVEPVQNPFLNAEFMRACNLLLDALAPFPDAHARAAEVIAKHKPNQPNLNNRSMP